LHWNFTDPSLLEWLEAADDAALDAVPFGVVAMTEAGIVTSYNAAESRGAGLTPARVVGRHFFSAVAPCTNNFMVAHRFETEPVLDAIIDYVFTLRMKPTKVKLRLLRQPGRRRTYLLVERASAITPEASPMEDLLQFLYLMPFGVMRFQADGTVDLMNAAASALLLSLRGDDSLRDIYTSLAPLAPDLPRQVARFPAVTGTIVDKQWLATRAGGRAMVLSLTVSRVNTTVYMAMLVDVTTLSEQGRKIYVDRQKFYAIFENLRDYAIYTITMEGKIEEWNRSLHRVGGWLAEDVQGRDMGIFLPAGDPHRTDALLADAKRTGSVEIETWRLKRDGTRFWGNTVITALPDEGGEVRGFVVVTRDLTERKRTEDELKTLATVDPLTGAFNRRQGDALLAAEFARRSRDGRDFAVLLLDIDHFKAVNDQFGHAVGDAVLCALVGESQKTLRTVDMLIRWGGEEFLFVLPNADGEAAIVAAERIRTTLAATEIPGAATLRVTVSIGVATPMTDSPPELLRRADLALYAAKAGGRNRVVLAPESAMPDYKAAVTACEPRPSAAFIEWIDSI
jgi:photoactive yellow protein